MNRSKRPTLSPADWRRRRSTPILIAGTSGQLRALVRMVELLRGSRALTPQERAHVQNKIKEVARFHLINEWVHDSTPAPRSVIASLSHKHKGVAEALRSLEHMNYAEDKRYRIRWTGCGAVIIEQSSLEWHCWNLHSRLPSLTLERLSSPGSS